MPDMPNDIDEDDNDAVLELFSQHSQACCAGRGYYTAATKAKFDDMTTVLNKTTSPYYMIVQFLGFFYLMYKEKNLEYVM